MRICERILDFVQVIDYKGTVRLCSWLRNNNIGSLSEQSMEEIYNGKRVKELRDRLMKEDYSLCLVDACPYLAMNDMGNHMVEIEEMPKFPRKLYLAYERVCNYSCISCNAHNDMIKNRSEDLDKWYDIIEERLKEVLPHVTTLSANGRGELFVSKRILKILADWKPLAPKEEVSVELETNGSLFDEEHWKQIENLGQYNLKVFITVMSFEEPIYQVLSGCKLPISQIEDNLRFVKSLREKGIINFFEIATVVQDRNFRALPEFARRCVEEFGADSVRLRPFSPWGSQPPETEWFMDVRNPQHPYYKEYKEVMKHPIFKHPLVHDWSGGLDTVNVREYPYKLSFFKETALTDIVLNIDAIIEKLKARQINDAIVVYGLGNVGKALVKQLILGGLKPTYILDKYSPEKEFEGVPVYDLVEAQKASKQADVIITPFKKAHEIKDELLRLGYEGELMKLPELLVSEIKYLWPDHNRRD